VPGQSKESLYNLSDSLRGYIQTSLREVCLSQGKGQRRSVLSIPRTIYLSKKTYNMENTIDLRKTGAENIIGKFSKTFFSTYYTCT
jgi:hypothetical protein